jgi:hypothetical protein
MGAGIAPRHRGAGCAPEKKQRLAVVGVAPGSGAPHLAAQRTRAAAGGLLAGEASALAVRDEVPAALDLAQNTVALDELRKAREKLVAGFAITGCYDKCQICLTPLDSLRRCDPVGPPVSVEMAGHLSPLAW